MRFTYINENKGFIAKSDLDICEPYDARAIVRGMINVRTAKDFIDLCLSIPCSFVSKFIHPFFDDGEMLGDVLSSETKHVFRGNIEKALRTGYLDIDYLDEFLLREGVLGEVTACSLPFGDGQAVEFEGLRPNGKFEYVYLSSIENLITNVQTLAQLAAVVADETFDHFFQKQSIGYKTQACAVEVDLVLYSEFNSNYDQDSLLHTLFDQESLQRLSDHLSKNAVFNGCYEASRFIVPEKMTDCEIAGSIFSWFMNSLFEGSAETYYTGNPFKVDFADGKFRVRNAHSPIRDLYYKVAKLAEAGVFKLCKNCGRAFIDDKSRGVAAKYCSRSCNTQASNKRRDLAKQYREAGIPLEKAIQQIGPKYEKSIRQWYTITLDK